MSMLVHVRVLVGPYMPHYDGAMAILDHLPHSNVGYSISNGGADFADNLNVAVLQHEEIREQTRAAREDIPTTLSDMVRTLANTQTFRRAVCMCDLLTTQKLLAALSQFSCMQIPPAYHAAGNHHHRKALSEP